MASPTMSTSSIFTNNSNGSSSSIDTSAAVFNDDGTSTSTSTRTRSSRSRSRSATVFDLLLSTAAIIDEYESTTGTAASLREAEVSAREQLTREADEVSDPISASQLSQATTCSYISRLLALPVPNYPDTGMGFDRRFWEEPMAHTRLFMLISDSVIPGASRIVPVPELSLVDAATMLLERVEVAAEQARRIMEDLEFVWRDIRIRNLTTAAAAAGVGGTSSSSSFSAASSSATTSTESPTTTTTVEGEGEIREQQRRRRQPRRRLQLDPALRDEAEALLSHHHALEFSMRAMCNDMWRHMALSEEAMNQMRAREAATSLMAVLHRIVNSDTLSLSLDHTLDLERNNFGEFSAYGEEGEEVEEWQFDIPNYEREYDSRDEEVYFDDEDDEDDEDDDNNSDDDDDDDGVHRIEDDEDDDDEDDLAKVITNHHGYNRFGGLY